jgi:hypothetical protein
VTTPDAKPLVLPVYPGGNHGLAKKPSLVGYHRRILEWFDHLLRGAAAPAWIAKGVEHLDAGKARNAEPWNAERGQPHTRGQEPNRQTSDSSSR